MKLGIVGNGYVGQATSLLEGENVEVLIWDTDETKRNIDKFEDLSGCDLVFVCVPTPMNSDGSCYIKIVESVVSDLINLGVHARDIVVRSTVPVGTCEKLGVSFMPEFLTEANWRQDFENNENWIFGFDPTENKSSTDSKFHHLGSLYNKNVVILKTKEAELVKYTRNVFLATKVSFFNEIEQFCGSLGISYDNVRDGVCLDGRIGFSHTDVPGPDGRKGYGGTCFPKDVSSLLYQIVDKDVVSYIVYATRARNLEKDRPEKIGKMTRVERLYNFALVAQLDRASVF